VQASGIAVAHVFCLITPSERSPDCETRHQLSTRVTRIQHQEGKKRVQSNKPFFIAGKNLTQLAQIPFVPVVPQGPAIARQSQASNATSNMSVNIRSKADLTLDSSSTIPTIEILFTLEGNGQKYTRSGWSYPEPHGTWTIGSRSVIEVTGVVEGCDYVCWLPIGPCLHPPLIVSQGLRVTANGSEVYLADITENTSVEFCISSRIIKRNYPLEIIIHCLSPVGAAIRSSGATENYDPRELGFAVWGLRLTPKPSSVEPASCVDTSPTPSPTHSPTPRVAAVTMVFNEAVYLPIWLAHNARQVGIENCFVIDHGSTDGSISNNLGCNIIKIPRSPYDPAKQSEWNSEFCSSLLVWYDWVVYSDVDELLLADPAVASSLVDYCRRPLPPIVTAIGLNVLHRMDNEPPLDLSRPITEQRPYVFGCASMCKPLLIRRRVKWSPGSHSADAKLFFDKLYLFHLRWFDYDFGIERLHKTRAMAWAQADQGRHQRVQDAELEQQIRGFGRYQIFDGAEFDQSVGPVSRFLKTVEDSTVGRENELYKVDLGIWYPELWRLPPRFMGFI
jgi:Glycosyl transferase family 2